MEDEKGTLSWPDRCQAAHQRPGNSSGHNYHLVLGAKAGGNNWDVSSGLQGADPFQFTERSQG